MERTLRATHKVLDEAGVLPIGERLDLRVGRLIDR
jgi:hypothetical protein